MLAPNWALFHRLQISVDDLQAQEFGERLADEFEEAVCGDADTVEEVAEGGLRRVTATFDLTKDQSKKVH